MINLEKVCYLHFYPKNKVWIRKMDNIKIVGIFFEGLEKKIGYIYCYVHPWKVFKFLKKKELNNLPWDL